MSILVVGMNHRTAPVGLLERAAVPGPELGAALTELLGGPHVAEVVVLSTCNRVEVYAAVSTFHGALNDVGNWLSARTGVPLAPLADHLYISYAEEAVRHLFTVAAGLDSMVVGEAQILGQLRDAYALSQEHHGAGPLLHELMQQALRAGKRVHTDTLIDKAGQSVVSAALALGGDVAGRSALVVGAGSMGALAASTLRKAGAGHIAVLNRTPEKAARIASAVQGVAVERDRLPEALVDADVVVSVTGSTVPVITSEAVTVAQIARGGRPLVILDLAVPRDTDPAVADLPGVTLIGLEQLGEALADKPATTGVEAARAIIDDEVDGFLGWQRAIDVAPTVAALRARADQVVATELERLGRRLDSVDPAVRADVERTVRRVVANLLHLPTVRMKELATAPGGDWYATAVRDLFGLDVANTAAAAAISADSAGTLSIEAATPAGPVAPIDPPAPRQAPESLRDAEAQA